MQDLGELFYDLESGKIIKWYNQNKYIKESPLAKFIDAAVEFNRWSVIIIVIDKDGELGSKYKVVYDNGKYSLYILTDAGFTCVKDDLSDLTEILKKYIDE